MNSQRKTYCFAGCIMCVDVMFMKTIGLGIKGTKCTFTVANFLKQTLKNNEY